MEYISFDILVGNGDWLEYDYYAKLFVSSIESQSGISLPPVSFGRGYVVFIGLVYYLFNNSLILAVMANVYFVVTSAFVMYLLLNQLFDYRVARIGLYLSAFFPFFIIWEITLLKECYIFFLMVSASFVTYQYSIKNKLGDFFIMLFIYFIILNVRFYLLIPFFVYLLYIQLSNKKYLIPALAMIGIIFITTASFSMNFLGNIESDSIQDYFFKTGVSILDKKSGSFNYQLNLSNPIQIISVLFSNASFYLKEIPLAFTDIWTGERIYYIPFLSPQIEVNSGRALDLLMTYFSSLILWTFMFVSLWGFKQMVFNYTQKTAIIWFPLLIIPIINMIFAGNLRYMIVSYYGIIACIAFGIIHCRRAIDYIFYAWILISALILLVNKDTLITFSLLITISIILGFQFINWFYRKNKLLF